MAKNRPTTGVSEIDVLIGGVIAGDNVVWEVDSGAPIDMFVSSFLSACEQDEMPVTYVSFNRSPQTITGKYGKLMSNDRFNLVDCFSSGKGNDDKMFLDFFKGQGANRRGKAIHIESPSDPSQLQKKLVSLAPPDGRTPRYVFDSLTGMFDLWGDEDKVIRFFGHICPRLYDLTTIACWFLEKEAHSEEFLAKVRHITQVVMEVAVSEGTHTIKVGKAANRNCPDIGVLQTFSIDNENLTVTTRSREDRELGLLTRMGEALDSALDPGSFFERTMQTLADELGMIRATLVLLDRTSNKLKIAAAHGLSRAERSRGEYDIGEGVTGRVVQSGVPEVVRDINKDQRFLDRTHTRKTDPAHPIAFICVPLAVDGEVTGALSIDRPFAVEPALQKDLRLLSIVASVISQVLKINRLIQVEKEEILARDEINLEELRSRYGLDNIIGESKAIQNVLAIAATAAKPCVSVLITGETGTGKELIANVLHYNSDRAKGPLIKVNCGALPETLLESELFGHVKGAFTGAIQNRKGRFELADGGTLFLDEIGEMSPRLQVKLLRVLQEKEFEPVGSAKTVSVDVRVAAATSKHIKEEMRQGRFREDLYYRLNVVPIHLPPLRERREDIPLLVDHFLEKYNKKTGKNVRKISRKVLDLLVDYSWPGNVRELENCIERTVVMSPGDTLSVDLLPEEISAPTRQTAAMRRKTSAGLAQTIEHLVEEFCQTTDDLAKTKAGLIQTLEEAVLRRAIKLGLSQRQLADKLGMSRMTLRKRMREYGIQ